MGITRTPFGLNVVSWSDGHTAASDRDDGSRDDEGGDLSIMVWRVIPVFKFVL